jgi:anti-anti-sigma regulatory factor
MALTLAQDGVLSHLVLEGSVSIAEAAELKAMLLEALDSGLGLRIDLEKARDLDICVLQLLWCAERQWRLANRGLALQGPLTDAVAASFANAGMESLSITRPANALCEG